MLISDNEITSDHDINPTIKFQFERKSAPFLFSKYCTFLVPPHTGLQSRLECLTWYIHAPLTSKLTYKLVLACKSRELRYLIHLRQHIIRRRVHTFGMPRRLERKSLLSAPPHNRHDIWGVECEFLGLPGIWASTRVFLARLELGEVPLPLLRLLPNLPVETEHDGDGDVEGGDGRAEGNVVIRLNELNVTLVVRHGPLPLNVGPGVDPGGPEDEGNTPRSRNHGCRSTCCPPCPGSTKFVVN